jgi:hypothetical protein
MKTFIAALIVAAVMANEKSDVTKTETKEVTETPAGPSPEEAKKIEACNAAHKAETMPPKDGVDVTSKTMCEYDHELGRRNYCKSTLSKKDMKICLEKYEPRLPECEMKAQKKLEKCLNSSAAALAAGAAAIMSAALLF